MTGKRHRGFERAYSLVVLVKGLDGSVELLLGLLLLVAPAAAGQAVEALADELGEGPSPTLRGAAAGVAHAASTLESGSVLLAVFLLVHGVVKIATVVFLLKRLVRAYPWAIAALSVLLVLQVVDLVVQPSAGAALLAVLDVVVIALVAVEYRRLRREHAQGSGRMPGRPLSDPGRPRPSTGS